MTERNTDTEMEAGSFYLYNGQLVLVEEIATDEAWVSYEDGSELSAPIKDLEPLAE